jgi:hypothetical protein
MNGTSPQGYGSFGPIPTTWQITTTGDFNGDGKSDLMWRNTDGSTSLWLMNGTTVQGYGSFGAIPTSWQITATADFNGDGKSDLMWRQHRRQHQPVAHERHRSRKATAASAPSLSPGASSIPRATTTATARTTCCGGTLDGTTNLWLMNGTSVQTYGSLGQVATSWNVVDAHGDYNGDGKSDILWRKPMAAPASG